MKTVQALIDEAAKVCGGRSALARALGVPPANVTQWASGAKSCPPKHGARMAELAGYPASEGVLATAMRKLAKTTSAAGVGALAMLLSLPGPADAARSAAAACSSAATTMYRLVKFGLQRRLAAP
jgi:DNA-binding transcriptional regulator YdaS (Cro superfamily)